MLSLNLLYVPRNAHSGGPFRLWVALRALLYKKKSIAAKRLAYRTQHSTF